MRKNDDEPFVQVWSKLIHCGVSAAALKTYLVLRETAWSVGSEYFKGNDELAQEAEVSQPTVYRHLRELESVGAIEILQIGKRQKNRIKILPVESIINVGDRSEMIMHIDGDRSEMTMHIEAVTDQKRSTRPITDDHSIGEVDDIYSDTSSTDVSTKSEESAQKLTPGSLGAPGKGAGGTPKASRPSASPQTVNTTVDAAATTSVDRDVLAQDAGEEVPHPREEWVTLDADGQLDFDIEIPHAKAMEDFTESLNALVALGWTSQAIAFRLNVSCPSPRSGSAIQTLRAVAKLAVTEKRAAMVHA